MVLERPNSRRSCPRCEAPPTRDAAYVVDDARVRGIYPVSARIPFRVLSIFFIARYPLWPASTDSVVLRHDILIFRPVAMSLDPSIAF